MFFQRILLQTDENLKKRVILENAATSVVTRHRSRTDNNKMFSQPHLMNILRNKKRKITTYDSLIWIKLS